MLAAALASLPLLALDAPAIEQRCDRAISAAMLESAGMSKRRGGDVLSEWNRLYVGLEGVAWVGALHGLVHPQKAAREAGDACYARMLDLEARLFQDEALFKRVRDARTTNPRQAKFRGDLLDRFQDAGVSLAVGKRARVREIQATLESMRQRFFRNVDEDASTFAFTAEEARGVDERFLAQLPRDAAGRYVMPAKAGHYGRFMNGALDPEGRRRAMVAWLSVGGEANMALLDQIYALRHELATLLGAKSYAELAMRQRMAKDVPTVERFLEAVRGAIVTREAAEVAEVRQAKARDMGVSAESAKVVRADVPHYFRPLQEAHGARAGLEARIPTPKAIAYMLEVAERLYGIEIRRATVRTWHDDVTCHEALDRKTRKPVGSFCLDLYERDGKHGGDAAIHVIGASRLAHRRPFSVLIAVIGRENVDLPTLESVMHELGHVMHGVLSDTDYAMHSGTRVPTDFVEAPSQMFEAWASDAAALELLRAKCAECGGIDPGSLERYREGTRFGRGINYSREWMVAFYDMQLASGRAGGALAAWKRLQGEVLLIDGEGSMRPAAMRHLAGGYGAGRYAYIWSMVVAQDLLTAFRGGLLDPAVGRRLRDKVLSQGGQKPAADLVADFLGRPLSDEAFFKWLAE